jgi:hypothetical protein
MAQAPGYITDSRTNIIFTVVSVIKFIKMNLTVSSYGMTSQGNCLFNISKLVNSTS